MVLFVVTASRCRGSVRCHSVLLIRLVHCVRRSSHRALSLGTFWLCDLGPPDLPENCAIFWGLSSSLRSTNDSHVRLSAFRPPASNVPLSLVQEFSPQVSSWGFNFLSPRELYSSSEQSRHQQPLAPGCVSSWSFAQAPSQSMSACPAVSTLCLRTP